MVARTQKANQMPAELVMYSRSLGCPFVSVARRVLEQADIPYREIFIDQDKEARARVQQWTGFFSVPTLVISHNGGDLPYAVPPPLPPGTSPRGIDRGAMITEPSEAQLTTWLQKHGLLE
jgi:glutaredoxin